MERWLENFARANFRRSADTAHDLKTPLNVAVLNLELLRMRARKLTEGSEDDEKLIGYARAIETELRRMARIFDAFFLLSTPPREGEAPRPVDVGAIVSEIASSAGYKTAAKARAVVLAHEARIRQAIQLFFEGAARILKPEGRDLAVARDSHFRATISGHAAAEDFELSKIFKFYYTDPLGEADLSLAASRLITETYGGELNGEVESDKVHLRFSVPLGEQ